MPPGKNPTWLGIFCGIIDIKGNALEATFPWRDCKSLKIKNISKAPRDHWQGIWILSWNFVWTLWSSFVQLTHSPFNKSVRPWICLFPFSKPNTMVINYPWNNGFITFYLNIENISCRKNCTFVTCSDMEIELEKFNAEINKLIYKNLAGFWECSCCGYSSKFKGNLRFHVESKHLDSPGFQCHSCPKILQNRKALVNHISRYHR